MLMEYVRGMVFYANIPNVIYAPSVQAGRRPVIIVSNDVGNIHSQNVTVVPCTTNISKKDSQPTHYTTRLRKDIDTIVLCEDVMTIDKSCLDSFVGVLDDYTMEKITECLGIALGFTNLKLGSPASELRVNTLKAEPEIVTGPRSGCAGGLTGPQTPKTKAKNTEEFMKDFIKQVEEKGVVHVQKKYGISSTGAVYQRCMRYKKLLDTK